MTYCNPCLAPVAFCLMFKSSQAFDSVTESVEHHHFLSKQADAKPNVRRNLFEEAKELDILVKNKNGAPYMVANTAFDVGMLDFTHPHTNRWFKTILAEMVNNGVRGWMADFGEGLPVDASLYSGSTSSSLLFHVGFMFEDI